MIKITSHCEVQKCPPVESNELTGGHRAETGPMSFGNDHTGLFIRGDDCFNFWIHLRNVKSDDFITNSVIDSLKELLASTNDNTNPR